jgi:hypothetical protein
MDLADSPMFAVVVGLGGRTSFVALIHLDPSCLGELLSWISDGTLPGYEQRHTSTESDRCSTLWGLMIMKIKRRKLGCST